MSSMNPIMNPFKERSVKRAAVLGIVPIAIGLMHYFFSVMQDQGSWVDTALLMLGVYGGFGLLLLDVEWLYQYYTQEPLEPPEVQQPPEYITRSALFILTLIPLTIFMLTSTGSSVGMGMLMGILIGISLEMFALRRRQLEFQNRFLSQVKRVFNSEEIEWIALGVCTFTAIVSLLVVL